MRDGFCICGHAGLKFTLDLVSQVSPYQLDLLTKAYQQLIQENLGIDRMDLAIK